MIKIRKLASIGSPLNIVARRALRDFTKDYSFQRKKKMFWVYPELIIYFIFIFLGFSLFVFSILKVSVVFAIILGAIILFILFIIIYGGSFYGEYKGYHIMLSLYRASVIRGGDEFLIIKIENKKPMEPTIIKRRSLYRDILLGVGIARETVTMEGTPSPIEEKQIPLIAFSNLEIKKDETMATVLLSVIRNKDDIKFLLDYVISKIEGIENKK